MEVGLISSNVIDYYGYVQNPIDYPAYISIGNILGKEDTETFNT